MSLSKGSLMVLGITAVVILLAIATYEPGDTTGRVVAEPELAPGPDVNADGQENIHDLVRAAQAGRVQEAVPQS